MEFIKPEYKGNNIINLMSSISNNFDSKHKYNQLKSLPARELKKYDDIVLIVVDGLGYNYLSSKTNSFLYRHLKNSMTTVFPSTTACANSAYFLGYPPGQHGLTAWDVYLKEVGSVVSVLPFKPAFGGDSLENFGFKIGDIIEIDSYKKNFDSKNKLIIGKEISDSGFTKCVAKDSEIIPAKNFKDNLRKVAKEIKSKSSKRRFLHSYIDEFDSCAHENGVKSKETKKIFNEIDKEIELLHKKIKNTNTKVMVVSDHGFIDTPKKKILYSDKIKGLEECLSQPLSGDARIAYAYVKKGYDKKFKDIVKTELKDKCWIYKSEDLVKQNFFGLYKHTRKIYDRIGDYTLIMKENYRIKSVLGNTDKNKKEYIGHHSGISEDEMLVPLIHFDA